MSKKKTLGGPPGTRAVQQGSGQFEFVPLRDEVPDDDEWLASGTRPKTRCRTCADVALPYLKKLLGKIVEKGATASTNAIYERTSRVYPGFEARVGLSAFRSHLKLHEKHGVKK